MNNQERQNRSYDSHSMLKDFDSLMQIARKVGIKFFEDKVIDRLAQDARVEYEKIIHQLPYVGGDASMFTDLMVQSGQTVAFYKACKEKGIQDRLIGELLYEIAEEQVRSVSWIKKWLARNLFFTRSYRNKWKSAMEDSQKREYSTNWVGEFVEGDEKNFDYGFDFLECGYLKLAQSHGGEEFGPYVCLCDFARMRGLGIGFQRTQTLARGHPRCDFRFKKGIETLRGWPPEILDEVKNSPTT
ncbi:MAG: L-2-amino-thiazoline-4-carboxylic acid hydrolase [Candidatus Thorarchaeota archaeon]